jgi:hypothetical protein
MEVLMEYRLVWAWINGDIAAEPQFIVEPYHVQVAVARVIDDVHLINDAEVSLDMFREDLKLAQRKKEKGKID